MARPDPRMVPRLPMARRQTHVTWTRGGDREEKVLQLFWQVSELDAFHQLIERSEAITEGRIETTRSGDRLFGSTVITLDLGSDLIGEHPSPALSEQLKITLDDDARVDRIVAARVFREITRLAGHRTTDEFDSQPRYATAGCRVRIHADFDMPVAAAGVVGE